MRQAGPEIITLMIDENLCLVLQSAESGGMNDAVTITLKGGAVFGAFVFAGFDLPSPAILPAGSIRG